MTLQSKCWDLIEPYLLDGVVPSNTFKDTLKAIHTKVVGDSIRNLSNNRLKLTSAENQPARVPPSSPMQLRSGHCAKLKDYQLRIGKTDDNVCLDCRVNAASTSHLFQCPSHPTNLTTKDLWERPMEAISHISQFQGFNSLQAVGPPPPQRRHGRRPPAEPPPSP